MRVSTSTMQATLLAQAMRVQSDFSTALVQQGSELKSATLSGLNGAAGTAISLESDLKASAHLVSEAENAKALVDTAYGTLADIVDVIETAKVDIAAAINGTITDTGTLQTSADGWLKTVASLFNTDVGGRAVFGGNGATAAPVDLNDPAYDPLSAPALPDGDYYQGAGTDRILMVDGDTGLTYGVRADGDGAEKTLRALSLLAGMTTNPPDTALMQDAYDLLDDAATALATDQEALSGQSKKLSTLIDSQTEFQLYAESALDSITKVDVAAATATVAQHEAVLQASFSALSSLTSISLTDYVR
ncbi:flagellin [Roseospira visakhapatnamensis]|uniref:Flagellar hook-associated protein 3 FlgL n=1 Tax=Roseospira visakhapatnamensis TaxID=390880 RepID=A0A7W6W9I8_9PROT|nr:flagellin [Roseospira visakhapatnamensis]MBB4265502.1 flagellar hook-associated protein 3 FlgL [Roseospira visakhapatnamensis]